MVSLTTRAPAGGTRGSSSHNLLEAVSARASPIPGPALPHHDSRVILAQLSSSRRAALPEASNAQSLWWQPAGRPLALPGFPQHSPRGRPDLDPGPCSHPTACLSRRPCTILDKCLSGLFLKTSSALGVFWPAGKQMERLGNSSHGFLWGEGLALTDSWAVTGQPGWASSQPSFLRVCIQRGNPWALPSGLALSSQHSQLAQATATMGGSSGKLNPA